MPKMIILVMDQANQLPEVMRVWQQQGAAEITLLESSGLRHLTRSGRDDLPLFPSLHHLLEAGENHNHTLFAVVRDDVDLEVFFDATEAVTGPLSGPDAGVLLALPLLSSRGLGPFPR